MSTTSAPKFPQPSQPYPFNTLDKPTMASRQEVLHAYRHLYKGLLRGVQYSIPARYIVRDQIRLAFRQGDVDPAATTWDASAIKRTLWFLSAAGREKGLEHRILRNLGAVLGQEAVSREIVAAEKGLGVGEAMESNADGDDLGRMRRIGTNMRFSTTMRLWQC
ncbi:hypothetical protein CCM_00223 [Cordyceps militaris CM01]|uniref:Complex 1 LYR protein n=1 Tax=Cordyceps militaris (strain CM01) TaxID=983644 RepID=G3J2N3_CORMM|nr:uncharacterized protein CCM_00223 [Cordyceps militaris CM01]EGX95569.1 hypothetical protein CCM_00223 [Cordyceps militaris CM01]